jgi:hypothetical protein
LIELLLKRNQKVTEVPQLLHSLLSSWSDDALKTEGLFRLAPSKIEVDALRVKIDDGKQKKKKRE